MILFNGFTINIEKILLPIIYIAIGFITYKIIEIFIKNSTKKSLIKKRHHKKRMTTINSLILNLLKYIIILFVITAILSNFGIDVKSILAGIGIAAAIIGLAFQDIAKDFLAGISIVLEDQYEIGDIVEINEFMGEVVSIGLRTTRIRNFHLNNTKAIVDISVAYEHSSEEVEKILEKMCNDVSGKIPKTKGKIQLLGINEFDDSGVIYRLYVETQPGEHIPVERALRKEIKKALDEANIKIPYKQIEVHNGKNK